MADETPIIPVPATKSDPLPTQQVQTWKDFSDSVARWVSPLILAYIAAIGTGGQKITEKPDTKPDNTKEEVVTDNASLKSIKTDLKKLIKSTAELHVDIDDLKEKFNALKVEE